MDRVKQHLEEHGVKPSIQRMAIMRYLMDHHTHPTADMIFNDLYPDYPTLSKTTVYNTLRLLSEQGAVRMIGIEEKNARFDGDMTPHGHFRCKCCGCIYDIPLEHMSELLPESFSGLTVEEVHVYFKGLCKACKQAVSNPS
jgi:Fe2+ or Zn2+ uptake regulation protein